VWLSARETALLREVARYTGRTQSDVIRLGIRLVADSTVRTPRARAERRKLDWFTRQEETVIALTNAKYPPDRIARELSVSEVEVRSLMESIDRKMKRFAARKPVSLGGT
jgi:DNA-binding CsgD family transcriptional regulator